MNVQDFIKNRKCFKVAKYALADVIEALSNDQEHLVDIVVTKEDGDLVVMFDRKHKSISNTLTGTDTHETTSNCEQTIIWGNN